MRSPSSIYWAFESKEGRLAAVMERSADGFFATSANAPRDDDPWQRLSSLVPAPDTLSCSWAVPADTL